jgi:long-chain acyl-CoA synthetase
MSESRRSPTLIDLFVQNVRTRSHKAAVWYRRNGTIICRTWNDLGIDVVRTAAAIRAAGVAPGDRVAFVCGNRYEWLITDLAILGVGAVHLPIHNTLTGPQIRYQVADSGAKMVIVAGDEQIAKLNDTELMPNGVHVVSLDPTTVAYHHSSVSRLQDAADVAGHPAVSDDLEYQTQLDLLCESTALNDLATIIYTSGTTGEPKGVMLSHGNLTSNAQTVIQELQESTDANFERRMNLLPLSHIFARTCDFYVVVAGASELTLAESPLTAVADCGLFQPTLLNAVPYFFEKIMRSLIENGAANLPGALQRALGNRLRWCCSGGAPLPEHVGRFYAERGLLLVQGYGLTESSPVITINTNRCYRHGTIGRTIAGVEVRFADDGELLTRGPHVMMGYWNRPEETAAALQNGWLHTGDLGSIDSDGFIRITGRKKELIVTTGGKKIVPSAVEHLLTSDPMIRQAAVIGDGRNYLTALVVPNTEVLCAELIQCGHSVTPENVHWNPVAENLVMDRIRKQTSSLSAHEQIRRIVLLEREFSVAREELTLTMKLRRKTIAENFAATIDRLYSGDVQSHGQKSTISGSSGEQT